MECQNLASHIFGFFYEGLGESLMRHGWMSCQYRVSLRWELATLSAGGVGGPSSRGIIGDRQFEGGTGLGECEAFMLCSKCIGEVESTR